MATILNPHEDRRFLATTLRAHVKLHGLGLRHSRMSPTALRQKVEDLTEQTFKRGDWAGMEVALTKLIRKV